MNGTDKQIQKANEIINDLLSKSDVQADKIEQLRQMLIVKKPEASYWIELGAEYFFDSKNAYQQQVLISRIIKGEK